MIACIGFAEAMPDIAKAALAADEQGLIYDGPERSDWTP
jgi:hypothetical protein